MRVNIDRGTRPVEMVLMFGSRALACTVQEYYYHGNVIVEMPPCALLDLPNVFVPDLSFPCSLLEGSSHQPPRNSLEC